MRYLYNYTYCHSPLVQNKIESKMEERLNLEEPLYSITKEIGFAIWSDNSSYGHGSQTGRAGRGDTLSFYGISGFCGLLQLV